jgi:Tfp pilus assembly ATPase PilU
MQTMDASLAQLTRQGKITRQLAESRAHSVEEFRRLIGTDSNGHDPAGQHAVGTR